MDSTASMVDRKAAAADFLTPQPTNMPTRREVHVPSDPVAERKVRQAIEGAASQNTHLLGELDATCDSPGQLGHSQVKIDHVDKRLADLQPEVEEAIAAVNQQLKSHKSYRDSVAKKFVYTILKKKDAFDDKAMREERAYHEVLEKRHKLEAKLKELKADKAALDVEMKALQELVGRHVAAHKELDALYSTVFDGPTAGFPDEDEREQAHKLAKLALQERTEALKAAVRGVKAVQAVKVAIDRATFEKQRASLENHSDIFSQRSVHTTLNRCVAYINRGLELGTEAINAIQTPPEPDLIQAKNALSQLLVKARATAQERLKDKSQNSALLERLGDTLTRAMDAQKQYLEAMKKVSESRRETIRRAARALEDERRALQHIRQSAFETTVGFGAAAPAYNECCDRAPWFESQSNEQSASIVEPTVMEIPEDSEPPPEYMYFEDGPTPAATEGEPGAGSQNQNVTSGGQVTGTNPQGLHEVT
ncbi:hypothetical protein TARUN_6499 [Trichoderma arundinaceum]|uniref:Uncharacterized protein n=1 Tax=Trichoderma arundinaceum TaxID=490622 RepID=A0A395NI67_TRIAR|nr:hypothetical protein TARUN_6499 [Trichoderma arundinaceum]